MCVNKRALEILSRKATDAQRELYYITIIKVPEM